jgi:hypothetical protein
LPCRQRQLGQTTWHPRPPKNHLANKLLQDPSDQLSRRRDVWSCSRGDRRTRLLAGALQSQHTTCPIGFRDR